MHDAHLAFLAAMHEAGHLLAAGPLSGAPDEAFCGLSIWNVEPDEARALHEEDPAVRAGRFTIKGLPWRVPGGAMAFSPTRFPHSIAQAMSG